MSPLAIQPTIVLNSKFSQTSRGQLLVTTLWDKNRVVLHNLDSGEQSSVQVMLPGHCAVSQFHFAVIALNDGARIYTHNGDLVGTATNSQQASSVAFHLQHAGVLAIDLKTVKCASGMYNASSSSLPSKSTRIASQTCASKAIAVFSYRQATRLPP
jgi:hypothetical protein